jgi:hypothetical protein
MFGRYKSSLFIFLLALAVTLHLVLSLDNSIWYM